MKSSPLVRKVGLVGTGFLRSRTREARSTKPKMKSRGMTGRQPTAEEQRFMDAIAALGCLACLKDGRDNPWISLHHIDGRTKPGAHFEVLPLCGPHHQQDDTDPLKRVSVHGRKATFVRLYGTELELLAWAKTKLGEI
jgi:hypothetical protein